MSTKLNQACSYTFAWNSMHFPAGVVPFTFVKPNECDYVSSFKDTLTNSAIEGLRGSAGLPVGVQVKLIYYRSATMNQTEGLCKVVTLPWEDEECVQSMMALEKARKHFETGELVRINKWVSADAGLLK